MNDTFSIKEAFQTGWGITRKNFWYVVGVVVAIWLIIAVPDFLSQAIKDRSFAGFVVLQILSGMLAIIVNIGMIKIFLNLVDGSRSSFNELFAHYKLFFKFLGTVILYGFIVLGGLILLVVPGIIFAMKFLFANYLVVDKELGPIEALKESAIITKDQKLKLLTFTVLIAAVTILGALLFIVGLIVAIPIVSIAQAFVYRKLSNSLSIAQVAPQESVQAS